MLKRILAAAVIGVMVAGPAMARTPNDPDFDEQWYLEQIDAPAAWDVATGSRDVVVAVLDSGVDLDHPDLVDNIWTNPNEIAGNGVDDDRNGYVDDNRGWDFVEDDNTPEPSRGGAYSEDGVAHGTVIAGLIGAVGNNGEGIAGVSWKVQIMSLRILDNVGSGESADAREAIEYAIANGADVINLSFTGYEVDEAFERTVNDAYVAGIPVVAAVGNLEGGGLDIDETPVYPACFEGEKTDWVIGVAATTREDTKAEFSNYGADCTELSAPGEDLYGTMYQDDDWDDFQEYYEGGWSGTSVAAPLVTGAIALLKSAFPSLTPSLVRTVLQLSADPLKERGTDAAGKLGTGRLNVGRAMEIAPSFAGTVAVVEEQEDEANEGLAPSRLIAVAPAKGSPPTVRLFADDGTLVGSFDAYASSFAGGVRVAMGDVDGDNVDEVVAVPGPGGGPQVRIFETDGTVVSQFFAFETTSRTGLHVSVADMDGNGTEEVVVSEDAGGGGRVRVFTRAGAVASEFVPFAGTSLSVRVAGADLDGDGMGEIVASLGAGSGPRVRVLTLNGVRIAEFDAYAPTYDRGVFVSAGDIDGDGDDEIVTGTDQGGGPHVRAFSAEGGSASGGDGTYKVVASFFAYDPLFRGGVRVTVGRLDGADSIITAAGPGGGPHVRIFNAAGSPVGGFFSDAEADRDGITVGAWSP